MGTTAWRYSNGYHDDVWNAIRLRPQRRATPVIATALFAAYESGYAISIYIAACAAVSLVSAAFMPDYTGRDISMEYDD